MTRAEPGLARHLATPAPTWVGGAPTTGGEFEQHRFALRSASVLFLVSGVTTGLGGVMSSDLGDAARAGLVVVGVAVVMTAVVITALRHLRWGRAAMLSLLVPALVAFGIGNYVAPDPYIACIYLFVIAVWIGISQGRGVNLALAPLYALTYWLPLWAARHGPTLNGSVPYVVIVAVATGETVAWLTSRLASASDGLRERDQQRFAALAERSSDVTMVVDREGTVSYVTSSVAAVFGYQPAEIEGSDVADIIKRYLDPDVETQRSQEHFEARLRHADGTWLNVEVQVRDLLDDEVVGAVFVDVWDITNRVQAQASLEASEEGFRLLFELSPLPTMVLDPTALRCLRVNDAACAHYGYERDEFLTLTLLDLLPSHEEPLLPLDAHPAASGYLRPGLWKHQTRDRRLIDVEIAVNRTAFAGVDAWMVLVVDVSDQRLRERQLRHQALHDHLTGLANRALLLDRLGRALAASSRQAPSVAMLFCDLDGFKAVNDRLSHGAGDHLLEKVATRLGDLIRPGDTLARFDADQFAIVVEQINDPGVTSALAERIIAALAQPFTVDSTVINMTVSIGIAFGSATIGADELARCADVAMRQAKVSGKNCYRVFETSMRSQTRRRLELSNDLAAALEGDQFRLQYQPHVRLTTGVIQGFEALVRWDHPRHGVIEPLDFIPLAEANGSIVALGRWILETACHEAVSWPSSTAGPLTIAVNLSVRQLRSGTMVDDVRTALALSGLDPSRLVLEITESVLMADTNATVGLITQLRGLGVGLAVDDFGTGYSSLSYLHHFRFDILKIDKTFVDALSDRPDEGTAFIRMIVTLGHTLGLHVITEGIETAEQYRTLTRLGSDSGQGYLMARPLDPDAAKAFIARAPVDYALAEVFTQTSPDVSLDFDLPCLAADRQKGHT